MHHGSNTQIWFSQSGAQLSFRGNFATNKDSRVNLEQFINLIQRKHAKPSAGSWGKTSHRLSPYELLQFRSAVLGLDRRFACMADILWKQFLSGIARTQTSQEL